MSFKLPRRAFLAGLGGTAVSLPLLEVMTDSHHRARADTPTIPCRYVVCFAGVSLGMRNLDRFLPDSTGPDFDLKRCLAPLAPVKDLVTLVTGMEIPWAQGGSGPPAAGRVAQFHSSTISPLLSGMRSDSGSAACRGPTSEQLVADVIAEDTAFRTLEYRVQADAYRGHGGGKGRMSFASNSGGSVRGIDPVASPRLAFDNLFTGFAPTDPSESAERDALLERNHSVLDLVRMRAERLESRLGRPDKLRLEEHFNQIRELELRLRDIPEIMPGSGGTCSMVDDPGEDRPVMLAGGDTAIGYADEEARAQAMTDLVHMALACDLSRSVALMYTFVQSFMNVETIIPSGLRTDMHELGHYAGTDDDHADGFAWHVRHWANLIQKLADTPEGDGSLLDHCAAVFVTEGGHGADPEGGSDGDAHSSENMAMMIAGGAGGLMPRGHIRAPGAHPAQVIVSAMNAVGVAGGLGEVPSGLPQLGT